MTDSFGSFCDDFYVNMRLGSHMPLPNGRDTALHFFEQVQKRFPQMTRFRKGDSGEMNLEEDRAQESYRWLSLDGKRLTSGHVNPITVEDGLGLPTLLLELAPHQLGISGLEIDYLDVLLGFDLEFAGNHDEIVAESLMGASPLLCLGEEAGARFVDFQPSVTMALSEDCRLQARIDVVTRTSSYQVRSGEYGDEVISVYLILRRYWGERPRMALEEQLKEMAQRAEQLAQTRLVPNLLKPISTAIASRS
jgi:hypothetical protein